MKKNPFFMMLLLFVMSALAVDGQMTRRSVPKIGGQVFIEPGQSPTDIDRWMATLAENDMKLCRIRMFEKYMRTEDGGWDFTWFDHAFQAAEKYGVEIYATLFPYTEFTDVGGFKFPRSREHQSDVAEYIRRTVTHFSQYGSLSTWVLINEPGSPNTPFGEEMTDEMFALWRDRHPAAQYNQQGWPVSNYDRERFVLHYHTWYLDWLAKQVRQYDSEHDLHVNPHQIFRLCTLYDFPAWRPFLNTLGGSAHASWHFGYFARKDYALAMSANAEMIRSGAGELPWVMTELQGGNNIYSGGDPMCPTAEEITQWLWINLATEAKGGIFWSLNPRATGDEAGEWALLDFTGGLSDRMRSAARIGSYIDDNRAMMSGIESRRSGIVVLYNRESMWVESAQAHGRNTDNARGQGAVIRSPLGWFETLSQMGLRVDFAEFRECVFETDPEIRVVILSHQIAIDPTMVERLKTFVAQGGTLIVDGLTGFYDDQGHSPLSVGRFQLTELFGAWPTEFKLVADRFSLTVNDKHTLDAHMWRGTVDTSTALPLGAYEGQTTCTVNRYGKGQVFWIPSLVGLGTRRTGNYRDLALWIREVLPSEIMRDQPMFSRFERDVVMKAFDSDGAHYALVISKSEQKREIEINNAGDISVVFSDKRAVCMGNRLEIAPEETVVLKLNK